MKNFDQTPSIYCKTSDNTISNKDDMPFNTFNNFDEDLDQSKNESPKLHNFHTKSVTNYKTDGLPQDISSAESFGSLEKLERRDSGFHTLSRASKCNGGVSPLVESSERNTTDKSMPASLKKQSISPKDMKIEISYGSDLLESPSENTNTIQSSDENNSKRPNVSIIAQKLFHMQGFNRHDVVKYLTKK